MCSCTCTLLFFLQALSKSLFVGREFNYFIALMMTDAVAVVHMHRHYLANKCRIRQVVSSFELNWGRIDLFNNTTTCTFEANAKLIT